MQDSSLHSVASTQIFNGHITEEIIYQEFVKMGMQDFVANDLSKRYYRNELTYKDIEYLESNFNLKLEMLERSLKSEIISVKTELDNKIDIVENNLNVKIDTVRSELKSDIKDLDNKIDIVRNELKFDIKDLDNKIDVNKMELKSTLRLHGWMFGILITLNIGIFLALMSLLVK
ncbi:Bdr family repetitive protein [Borrelia parkeri]|uniref:Bdr family repetitive protein n=1 Tax=Borrelia parkeri TaxID=141 RepID=UPI001FF2FBEB|nr:Bdr family repetitive protein [Borrelia parkeri]